LFLKAGAKVKPFFLSPNFFAKIFNLFFSLVYLIISCQNLSAFFSQSGCKSNNSFLSSKLFYTFFLFFFYLFFIAFFINYLYRKIFFKLIIH